MVLRFDTLAQLVEGVQRRRRLGRRGRRRHALDAAIAGQINGKELSQ
jgi:hypothetical protein